MTKSLGLIAFVMIFVMQAGSASAKQWCTKSKYNTETVCRTTSDGTGFRPKRPVFVPGQAGNTHLKLHNKAELAVFYSRFPRPSPQPKAILAVQAAKQRPVFVPHSSRSSRSRLH